MHRVIVGVAPEQYIDHINGDGLDNRRANLRVATNRQNQQNRQSTRGSSPYKGVGPHRRTGKWRARIMHLGKRVELGEFDNPEDAAAAYDAAARQFFGEFAYTNLGRGGGATDE